MGWGIDPENVALGVWFCTTGSQLDIRTSVSGNGTFGRDDMLGSEGMEEKRSSYSELTGIAGT